jgi:hypothetical protein
MKQLPAWLGCLMLWLLAAAGPSHAQEPPAVITVLQARSMDQEGSLAHIAGQVTWRDDHFMVVQDATDAILIQPTTYDVELGDAVDVVGMVIGKAPDNFMLSRLVNRNGQRPLPAPAWVSVEMLQANAFRDQRVRLRGTIHDVGMEDKRLRLLLQSKFDAITILVPIEKPVASAFHLLDALVEVTAIARMDGGRGSVRGTLYAASLEDISIVTPGSEDVFTRPR